MRHWTRRILTPSALALVGAVAAVAPAGASTAAHHHPAATGHVYVDDNTAGANTIAGFTRHADGSLTPLAGSPFPAGGAGTGSGLASQGAIQLADHGRLLVAVDAGSDQVSVLRVGGDGRPHLASVTSSGGSRPVSVAVHDDLVYVANAGDADSDYTGFRLGHDARLHPIAGSTVQLPAGSQPGDVLFNRDGTRLVGTRVNSSLIDSFVVRRDGRLTAAPGSPYTAQGLGPFGSAFRPTRSDQLFVSNAHDGAGAGTVSAFHDGRDGTLTPVAGSPFPNGQTAPCWVEITRDGRFLFAVNTGSGSVSRYAIAGDGHLTLLGTTPVAATGGVGAVDARLTPDGRTLYVDESRVGAIGAFAVHEGTLTELAGSPTALPTGATPAGVAVG